MEELSNFKRVRGKEEGIIGGKGAHVIMKAFNKAGERERRNVEAKVI